MINFLSKIDKFMQNRYGIDDLCRFMFYCYLILAMFSLFFKNIVISSLEFILMFVLIYRIISKNIKRRQKENTYFIKTKEIILVPFINIKRNLNDKEHIYKRCSCGTTLKLDLPRTRGVKHAKCPNCKKRISFFTMRKEKIVIIPKEKDID